MALQWPPSSAACLSPPLTLPHLPPSGQCQAGCGVTQPRSAGTGGRAQVQGLPPSPLGSGRDRTGCLSLPPSPRQPQPLPAPRAEPGAISEGRDPFSPCRHDSGWMTPALLTHSQSPSNCFISAGTVSSDLTSDKPQAHADEIIKALSELPILCRESTGRGRGSADTAASPRGAASQPGPRLPQTPLCQTRGLESTNRHGAPANRALGRRGAPFADDDADAVP